MFSHELEELIDAVMGFFGEVFYDFVGDGVWAGRFALWGSLTSRVVVAAG
jgi:hypothetical protein